MGEKFSIFSSIMLIFLLIGAFGLYVYIFGAGGDLSNFEISRNSKILGINTSKKVNNNFAEPEDVSYRTDTVFGKEIEEKINSARKINKEYRLVISKLNVDNKVKSINNFATFQDEGLLVLPWTYKPETYVTDFLPWTKKTPAKEAVIVCYRRFYGPSHSKGCYNLDQLTMGDEINFDGNVYKIEKILIVPKDQATVFEAGEDPAYLKMITNSGPKKEAELNSNNLVIIAKK